MSKCSVLDIVVGRYWYTLVIWILYEYVYCLWALNNIGIPTVNRDRRYYEHIVSYIIS